MLLELVNIDRTSAAYTYETDTTLDKQEIDILYFKLGEKVITSREGQRAVLDGMFSSTEDVKRGQLFKKDGIIYRIIQKNQALPGCFWRYGFTEADVDDEVENTDDL